MNGELERASRSMVERTMQSPSIQIPETPMFPSLRPERRTKRESKYVPHMGARELARRERRMPPI